MLNRSLIFELIFKHLFWWLEMIWHNTFFWTFFFSQSFWTINIFLYCNIFIFDFVNQQYLIWVFLRCFSEFEIILIFQVASGLNFRRIYYINTVYFKIREHFDDDWWDILRGKTSKYIINTMNEFCIQKKSKTVLNWCGNLTLW